VPLGLITKLAKKIELCTIQKEMIAIKKNYRRRAYLEKL
jgi:hypothetical protein